VSDRLRHFIERFSDIASAQEARILAEGPIILADLVRQDDWLPEAFSRSAGAGLSQFLLYYQPRPAFSIMSVVWRPGGAVAPHNHLTWGLIGQLRGTETNVPVTIDAEGRLRRGQSARLRSGDVTFVTSGPNDLHEVLNDSVEPSISIHVYGALIGELQRSAVDSATGAISRFVSGPSNVSLPNPWLMPP
jgi:3-mercaptopropionate dioxygenase